MKNSGKIKKDTLTFDHVTNGYVRDVRFFWTHKKTIEARWSYRLFIQGNNIRQGWNKTEGGYAYGMQINANTTRAYVIDNKLEQLRHGIVLQQGANHCVIAYNHSKSNFLLHGNYSNNNLFEGNVADAGINFDNIHGPCGPYNTVYRNQSFDQSKGIGSFTGEPVSVIGNVVTNLEVRDEDFVGANRIEGTILWGELTAESVLPPSLYFSSKPSFLNSSNWPVYGPQTTADWGANRTTPAFDRDINVAPYDPNWIDNLENPDESPDRDGDFILDEWERFHFTTTDARDGTEDFDEDGQTDYVEFLAGTNPKDPADTFRIISTEIGPAEGEVTIRFRSSSSLSERKYRIYTSENLDSNEWDLVPGGLLSGDEGDSTQKTIMVPTGLGACFFKVEALMNESSE